MEYNQVKHDEKIFFLGIICLVLCLGFILFSLYLLPYLIWELHYDVPDFILHFLARLQEDYGYTSKSSKTLVWLLFFIPGLITGLISYYISHYFDEKNGLEPTVVEEQTNLENDKIKKDIKESAGFGLKILGLMLGIVIAILLLEYLISTT